ncbi:putative ferric-chelate reductase 1 homolog [Saccostrea echinata]|uniref:putative ferric-chelate reductase 1 homolog n=1 Tax=Saccostrea echinata TaxID=191078 RepID=UPI002A80CFCA|nr:putative ferric-chelate reductase 1 homolog [Saccostrea echinata]
MLVIYLSLGLFCGCFGYPSGAPESACDNMTPDHGVSPQTTPTPYDITLSASKLAVDENLTISISPKDGRTTFKGFLIEVYTDLASPVKFTDGEFTVPENAHTQCNGGATHSNANPKLLISLSWKPTASFTGKVKFRATIVQSYTIFWKDIESKSLNVDYFLPSAAPVTVTPNDQPRCEKGFGCFKSCPSESCDGVVQWKRRENFVDFSIIISLENPNDRWIAIGLSPNGKMPRTSVMMCMHYDDKFEVLDGINKGYTFSILPNSTLGLFNITANVTGQIMKCSFSRKINVSEDSEDVYSLNKKYFLLLGNGPVKNGKTGIPQQHEKIPEVSGGKVNFLLNEDIKPQEPSMLLYKLHGSLMIFAWIFLSSIGIITARYYKSEWKDMMPCGVKVWFAIHRTVMSLVFLVTTGAFVLIFIEVGSLLQEKEGSVYLRYHPALGISVMALTVVNPVMALFRCSPGHKYREVFHYSHMFVGTSAQILAAVTIYFGVNLEKSDTPEEVSYIVITYIATYVIIELILESEKYFRNRGDNSERQILLKSAANEYPSSKSQSKVNGVKLSILMLHVLCMSVYCLALIYFVASA